MPNYTLGVYKPKEQAEVKERVYEQLFAPKTPLPSVQQPEMSIPFGNLSQKQQEAAQLNRITNSLLLSYQKATREREILRDQNYMQTAGLGTVGLNENYEFEQSRDNEAEYRRQMYKNDDPESVFIQPDNSLVDPSTDSKKPKNTFRSVVNFLFSDEMGIFGLKWDDEAFSWNLDNFVNQITEHPYSTAFTLASYLVPIGLAWMKGARIAERGAALTAQFGRTAVEKGAATGRGFLGTHLAFKFDDHAKLVQTLAKPSINKERALFSKNVAKTLRKASTPEEVADIISPSELNKMLLSDWHQERYYELRNLAKQGKLDGIRQKASWAMWSRFGNKYFKQLQDVNKAQIENMDKFFTRAQLGRFLASAPTRLGEDANKSIYKFWLAGVGRNKEELAKKIGQENADWAERIAHKWEDLFVEQYDEGFVDFDTASLFVDPDRVGSGFHLPAIRAGTAGFEEIGGKLFTVAPGEYGGLIRRQKFDLAKALTGPTTQHRAKFNTAESVLDNLDDLITNPSKLTAGGFIKDNVLFQIHRNFRDIIVDATEGNTKWAQLVTSRAAYEALPKSAKKNWINFEELDKVVPGLSARMERMVKARVFKEGLDKSKYVDMPVVDREVVKQFFGKEGSARQASGNFAKFFELLTAVHKTSRCVVGETRILTDKGYIEIQDAFEYKDGYHTSLPEETPKVWSPILNKWVDVISTYKSKKEKVFKVILKDGTEIIGTPDHPLLSEGNAIKIKDLMPGTVIDYALGGEFPTDKIKINVNPFQMNRKGAKESSFEGIASFEFDETLAELIGWILGDGNIHSSSSSYAQITIGGKDKEYSLSRLSQLCDSLGLNYTISKDKRLDRDIYYFAIYSVVFIKLCKKLGIFNDNKKQLIVPEYIFRSPKSVVVSFLRGLYDTDGHVTKTGQVSLTSVYKDFIKDIKILLGWLGVRNYMMYEKRERQSIIQGRLCNTQDAYTVNFSSYLARTIAEELQLVGMPRKFNRIIEANKKQRIKQRNHYLNRVISIEPAGYKDVYDVCLNNPHVFSAVNIACHNTALNAPTHMSNLTGNMMFLAMAGMNPFSPQALNDGRKITKVFTKLVKELKGKTDETIETLMTQENLVKHFGEERFITDKFGKKIDLAEMLSDPVMKELVEAQAFDQVEGFNQVKKLLFSLEKLENSGWSDKMLETTARSIAGVAQVPGIKQTLHAASSAYLAEDMIPKVMYMTHLARKGWGRDAIVREIGRRLPQYLTVGQIQRKARRIVLPWITFPAEATRIMKNNMMDRPVAMMAWLQAPHIAQSLVSGLGMGPNFDEYAAAIEAAPPWAERYQTVMANGNVAPELMGAVGGGGVGGTIGAAVGGAKGAAIGFAGGAALGAVTGAMFGNEQEEVREFNRAWTLDFLPYSAIFPSSIHPYEWEKLLPTGAGGVPTPGGEVFRTAKDLTPVEPFAVFMPLLDLWAGRGSFGAEIEAKSGIDFAGKMALGLLGHLSPPVIQKYGMKLEGPAANPIAMADIFNWNGGQSTLPKALTATFGGLALGGLTFLGARTGLGATTGAAAGAALLSGTLGAFAGGEVNVQRLMTDLGIKPDRRTGDYGDWTLDFLANSFFGLNKSWKVSAGQAIYNQNLRSKRFSELRKVSVKDLRDAISTGSESKAMAALAEIKKTYIYEHGDTQIADREFLEWAKRTISSMSRLPIYEGLSEERILEQIQSLHSAIAEKNKLKRQQLAELRAELQQRQLKKVNGLRIIQQK